MSLTLHHSADVADLVEALATNLGANWPDDPMEPVSIFIGHPAMRRWLQHALATRLGVACRLEYPMLGPGLDAAVARLRGAPRPDGGGFWDMDGDDEVGPDALDWRVLSCLRQRAGEVGFEAATRYLRGTAPTWTGDEAIGRREWTFSSQVAGVLDDLRCDRADRVRQWTADPTLAGDDRWLAQLLQDTDAPVPVSGPTPDASDDPLHLFCTSSLGAGDRERILLIAAKADVHLYLGLPTDKQAGEGISASLGAHARDLMGWAGAAGRVFTCKRRSGDLAQGRLRLFHAQLAGELATQRADPAQAPIPTRLVTPAGSAGAAPETLEFFSTWGAVRQVEVLRDHLLTLFNLNPTLEPRDVQVLTPDVETFAPLVATIFAQRPGKPRGVGRLDDSDDQTDPDDQNGADDYDEGASARPEDGAAGPKRARTAPAIPVAIADLGLARTNPVAAALLAVLDLVGERVTANSVFDLLSLEPVRRRFAVASEELEHVQALIAGSGMRWGEDEHDRARFGQPDLDQNTLRFGMERLALGVLMPDAGGLTVVPGLPAPITALDVEGRDRASLVGRVAHFLATVRHWRAALCDPGLSVAEWEPTISDLLNDLTATSGAAAWVRLEVDSTIAEALNGIEAVAGLTMSAQGLGALLAGRFEQTQRGDNVHGGAVTFSGLQPMRSVPFRVTALLGMDDGTFPRSPHRPTWDPMAKALAGELDRRVIDRHLLLETLLCTRDQMLVFFTGKDVKSGEPLPAAVPVEEWIDAVRAAEGKTRKELVHETPLQPWSPAAFGGAGRTFDPLFAESCTQLQLALAGTPELVGLAASGDKELAPEVPPVQELTLDDLAEGLARPQQMLLKRLDLKEAWETAALEDREPVSLDGLQAWTLRNRILDAFLTDPKLAEPNVAKDWSHRFTERLRAEGTLPLEAGAESVVDEELEAVQAIWTEWGPPPTRGPSVTIVVGEMTLTGQAPAGKDATGDCLGWVTASKSNQNRGLLKAYVHLLAAVAAGLPVRKARVVGGDAAQVLRIGAPGDDPAGLADEAKAALTRLIAVWRAGRARPLPLFEKTSCALATAMGDDGSIGDIFAAADKVEDAWSGRLPEVDDASIRAFFGDFDPVSHIDQGPVAERDPLGFTALAARVWQPVRAAVKLGSGK